MKKLSFNYYMQIDYQQEVSYCNYTIKCLPMDNDRQRIFDVKIEMSPPSHYSLGSDGLKNKQLYGRNKTPHKQFYFRITGSANVGLSEYDEVENPDISMVFKHPHGLNVPGDEIKKYHRSLETEKLKSDMEKAIYVMNCLNRDYKYESNTTDIDTTAEQAFVQGHGVCQDYSHIYIALMHLSGIPARYVTGLIVGEGASHAWAECLIDGRWYGFDPTNNKRVYDEHIRLGVGRDARDSMINRGIMRGGGPHTQTVEVTVKETDED